MVEDPSETIRNYIITLRIHAISLVESHDLLEDRRTELRHKFLKCRKYLKIPLNLLPRPQALIKNFMRVTI
jgi:hypothetical protein